MSSLYTDRVPMQGATSAISRLRWVALLGLVVLCYWPGLYGAFVFDDDVNIIQNDHLRIASLSLSELGAAAWSGHAGPLGRPLAMLSFALNYYAGGFDAFQFKLVNLLIHLCNTLLVGALAQLLFLDLQRPPPAATPRNDGADDWAGWTVAALWGLHPLNLTSVLYVVQRMTSLSALFGLAALLLYSWYRNRTAERNTASQPFALGAAMGCVVAACLVLSALSKETGLLFGPLLLWIEFCVYRFRFDGNAMRIFGVPFERIVLCTLALGALYVAAFKLPSMLSPGAFANRDFTLLERALTQTRVLFFYLRMFVLPSNGELSLYHDDLPISHSLFDPPTTALAVLGLVVLTVVAIALRKRWPAVLFAWGWFLISHALESTVFALEMVHEHRNYFATIGLLLLVPLAARKLVELKARRVFKTLFVAYLGLLGFVTHVRAMQWSNQVDWSALEAANHPNSTRANYELARVYMILFRQTGESRFGALADEALQKATQAYKPGMLPYMARIQLAYFRGLEPDPELLRTVKHALKDWPYYNSNTATLNSLVSCQVQGTCHLSDAEALDMLAAALQNPSASPNNRAEVLKLVAQYRINRFHDLSKGTELIREAIAISEQASSRIMYAQALAMQAKYNDALAQLTLASSLDDKQIYSSQIERERKAIEAAKQN